MGIVAPSGNEGRRFELSEGVLIEMAPAGLKHGGSALKLGRLIGDFVDERLAPDLAVEVVSSGDSADEIEKKVNEYLKHSTRMVWVFYPKTKSVLARLDINGTLDGGVLPGFRLAVREVFGE